MANTGKAEAVFLEKSFDIKKAFTPTEDDFKKVAEIIGSDASNFGIYMVDASSNEIDSQRDKFEVPFLEKLALDYSEGRQVVFMHGRGMGIGRTFDSQVEVDPSGKAILSTKFYVSPEATLPTGNAKALIDSKIFPQVSVGVGRSSENKSKWVPSEKSEDGEPYRIFDSGEGVEAIHLGLVDIGANPSAAFKSGKSTFSGLHTFETSKDDLPTSFKMELRKYEVKVLQKTIELPDESINIVKELEGKVEDLQKQVDTFKQGKQQELDKLKEKYITLNGQIAPKADDPTKAKWKMMADALSNNPDLLKQEVEILEGQEKLLKQKQLTPDPKKIEKKEKDLFPGW